MQVGKLTNEQLERSVLARIACQRRESLLGPCVGEDCAALKLGGQIVVMTTDPITAASRDMGHLAVHVSCNDLASAGAEPLALLLTILAPPQATLADIEQVMDDVVCAAGQLHVDILGGHTEVTGAVNTTVLSVTAIGRAGASGLIRTGGMRPGDDIVLTKWAGLEGTLIIAGDHAGKLAGRVPEALLNQARGLAKYISVVPEGRIAAKLGATAMHDVTEGGVLGAAWEMASASGCGLWIDQARIPVLASTRALCGALGLDVYRLISSGCMLIACPDGEAMVSALAQAGIQAARIGRARREGYVLRTDAGEMPLAPPGADELMRL
nr:AIR synthase family protein [Maliibacterium massiliense]